jgi:signal transduction histidine kinase
MQLKLRGEKLYIDIVAAPKKDKSGAILVLQDKTEHHRIIEMRKDFVANASHELKTPITIIRGFAEALHDNPDLPKDTYEEITAKIVNNCEKMNNLIKDLLTLTDIEHIPESRLMECNLSEIAENAKTTVGDAYPDAEINIRLSGKNDDYYLLADPNLIELCLVNLVENAAKYSPLPADITITLDKTEEWMTVAVTDKGIGIASDELEDIFQRFYRSEKSRYNRKIGGSGLGLSIVETIIAKHFGKITVDSTEGVGSTFTVYLPLRTEADLS